MTVGSMLDQVWNQSEKLFAETHFDKPQHLLLYQKVCLLVSNLKMVFQKQLGDEYEKAGKVKPIIDHVWDILTKPDPHFEESIAKIIKDLAIPYYMPHVSNVGINFRPHIQGIFFGDLQIEGNFYYSNYPPKLNFQKATTETYESSQTQLKYSVPLTEMAMHKCTLFTAELTVDWKNGYAPWSWTASTFKIPIKLPPKSPGILDLVITCRKSQKHEGEVQQCDKEMVLEYPATPGWTIVDANTVYIGDSFMLVNRSVQNNVAHFVIDRKKSGGKFRNVIVEEKPKRLMTKNDLLWGETWNLNLGEHEKIKNVAFTEFTGKTYLVSSHSPNNNPFVYDRDFQVRPIDQAFHRFFCGDGHLTWAQKPEVKESKKT